MGARRSAGVSAAATTILVVLALTVGKAFVSVPGLWEAQAHQVRQLRLVPFETFSSYLVWWGPWLNLVGNIALFVPVGFVAYRGSVARAVLAGAGFSLGIEAAQYIFALGYSDFDDLLWNAVGAWVGAGLASISKSPVLLWGLSALNTVVLAALLALGLRP